MSAASTIEWTNATWNPVRGCALVSPGCTNCYAMRVAHRFGGASGVGPFAGLTQPSKGGPVWTGKVRLVPELLDWPLRRRKPLRIFVNSMSDLFHEDVPDAFIDQVFAVMALATHHTFQLLTKRPERMQVYCSSDATMGRVVRIVNEAVRNNGTITIEHIPDGRGGIVLPNVWLGVSVEDQARADERIPLLLQTPAAVRWISAEPLLGPVELMSAGTNYDAWDWLGGQRQEADPGDLAGVGAGVSVVTTPRIDWVVVGGESGPGARPMQPNWVRSLRDQCAAASVPFFFKQWGEWAPEPTTRHPHQRVGKKRAGRHLDGRTHDNYPA